MAALSIPHISYVNQEYICILHAVWLTKQWQFITNQAYNANNSAHVNLDIPKEKSISCMNTTEREALKYYECSIQFIVET